MLNKKRISYWVQIIITVVMLIALLRYCLFHEKFITHVRLNDGVTRVPIPEKIIRSKDCEAYHQWFYSHVTPLAKWSDRCPWAAPPTSSIGEFTVGGTKFWIPRKYLWPDQKEPDGETISMLMLLVYPDMTPVTNDDEKSKCEKEDYCTIKLSIKSSQKHIGCKMYKCDIADYEYKYSIDSSDLDVKKSLVSPKEIKYLPELDLTLYTATTVNDQYYIRGNKYQPDYWLNCHAGSRNQMRNQRGDPLCKSVFNLNQNIYIEYSFNKTDLLIHHDDIRKKIIEKLNQWQQPLG